MRKEDKIIKAIVAAARQRFTHYGFGKTTMAEVARDCNMSPGNLYRYFPGKLDIAAEIARETSEAQFAELEKILVCPDLSAAEKLRLYHFEEMRLTYHTLETSEKLFEMALHIRNERPDFASESLAQERELLVKFLKLGVESGEFICSDPSFAAETMQSATMKFKYPQLFSNLTLAQLERELDGVLQLILAGLQNIDVKEHVEFPKSVIKFERMQ